MLFGRATAGPGTLNSINRFEGPSVSGFRHYSSAPMDVYSFAFLPAHGACGVVLPILHAVTHCCLQAFIQILEKGLQFVRYLFQLMSVTIL